LLLVNVGAGTKLDSIDTMNIKLGFVLFLSMLMLFKMTKTLKGQIKGGLPDFKDNFIVGSNGSNLNDELA
jgi:hypothetical protein